MSDGAASGAGEGSAIAAAVLALRGARDDWRAGHPSEEARTFPSRAALERVVETLAAALFPRRLGQYRGGAGEEDGFVAAKLLAAATELEREIGAELAYWQAEARSGAFDPEQPATIVRLFLATLGEVRRLIDSDVAAAFLGDPAARSADEILVCYPGAIASLHHRIAHPLYQLGAPITARLVSEIANERTGVDIHPGATIGAHFFIDHGTGVVIGETAIIGERVRLYQHVTLGARTPLCDAPDRPRERYARHPIVEDDVVIYAGATILGRVTIGRGAMIGGNVWLLEDVPPGRIVAQPVAQVLAPADGERWRDGLAGD
ncbi:MULTISPECIES: serine O-acetyltransferase EpsC [unclassified Sphingomonas]|uniref:serine O-acetyltransferase EpsC n=1 Tax=unclassified Sphingomonas TaxID=196159 RepID=UPI001622B495|nr:MULTISPECIES: serine O-acetyltransferase EpsC [unclassified Sphingomonas]MBB3347990.1 serine O-acetyltransferase [Sphingomonas sp. BK069]MBB3473930.1 serine O-acetyltransferase [Sphingomonas sp. BK345]